MEWVKLIDKMPLESGIYSVAVAVAVAVGVRNLFRRRWSPEFIPSIETE